MNRNHFQRLACLRITEANILLSNNCYDGAYYLAGYAVECALKACIAKMTREYDFPDKKLALESYTHDLGKLARLAGLEPELEEKMSCSQAFATYWAVVKDWSEEMRYNSDVTRQAASGMIEAISDEKDGVMAWLKKSW